MGATDLAGAGKGGPAHSDIRLPITPGTVYIFILSVPGGGGGGGPPTGTLIPLHRNRQTG